ncbi:hypothetical protein OAH23_14485 [Verrucomicrobia bacterium]|nr:hypothetical protein [Verrucomicrobiota bacterium]
MKNLIEKMGSPILDSVCQLLNQPVNKEQHEILSNISCKELIKHSRANEWKSKSFFFDSLDGLSQIRKHETTHLIWGEENFAKVLNAMTIGSFKEDFSFVEFMDPFSRLTNPCITKRNKKAEKVLQNDNLLSSIIFGIANSEMIDRFFEVYPYRKLLKEKSYSGHLNNLFFAALNGNVVSSECNEFLESLLRNIEVRKTKWLGIDVHDVRQYAVVLRLYHLLVDASRLLNDWRFLNTALKVSDWVFPFLDKLLKTKNKKSWNRDDFCIHFHYSLGVYKQELIISSLIKI